MLYSWKGDIMIKGEITYNGLMLTVKPGSLEDLRDLQIIAYILNKHNIKVGCYDGEEYKPEVEMYNGIYQLDLGR